MMTMNKRTKTDRELLLDASLEFIMNSPEEVFDQYLKEAGEDGSELERRATDAIGAALARHESAAVSGSLAPAIQDKLEAQEAEIERLREFAELWYFVMDEAPRDFERIVSEYQPKAWLQEAAKLRAARKEQR